MSLIDRLRELRPGAVPGSLFDRLGGRATLERVHKVFYDKVYADPWLGQYFDGVVQKHIEDAQTDFMCMCMKGGEVFTGRMPKLAHMHIAIDGELFDLRHRLLVESLDECAVTGSDR
ncbi:MAG: group 1 truncated hemoglobin, partial [Planctomycetes bacterium]|nr:group 1 truncated hemoglobin [Planctomycetota bacterium]